MVKLGPLLIGRASNYKSNGHKELFDPQDISPDDVDYSELGATGTAAYGGYALREFNPKLQGKRGLIIYDKMRRTDAQIRATLRMVKAPMLSGQWYVEPASDSQTDNLVAQYVWDCLNQMSRTWTQVLWESLLHLDFGFYIFEKVFEDWSWPRWPNRDRNFVKWQKWAPRHPLSVVKWEKDNEGGVNGIIHNRSETGIDEVPIDISKLLVFTNDEESGNMEGMSLLRSAYIHYYMKETFYKIDAIQKERHGIGIPRAKLPQNANKEDKDLAMEMVKNLRTNEKAGLVEPWNIVVDFITLPGQPVNVLESAQHHDYMEAKNVLAEFINLGTGSGGSSGSRAVGSVQADAFIKAIRYVADVVRGVINHFAIPELVRFNFLGVDSFPELKVRRLGEGADFRALAVALRNLVEVELLTPDPETEAFIRDNLDFPAPGRDAKGRTMQNRLDSLAPKGANRVPLPADGG